jgi:hypothetical protein
MVRRNPYDGDKRFAPGDEKSIHTFLVKYMLQLKQI